MKSVEKWEWVAGDTKAGRWIGEGDIRCYVPPPGWEAMADMVDRHPVTGEQMEDSEWWVFIRRTTSKRKRNED